MSKFQFRALAFCCWLVALCFGIATAAYLEEYMLYRGGPHVEATVTELKDHGGQGVWGSVTFEDHGRAREDGLWVPRATQVGSTLRLALHENNGNAILESQIGDKFPPLWFFLGLAASIALGVWLWRIPTRQARRRAKRTSIREVLVDAAARTRNTSLGIGIFLVICGGFFAIIPYFDREGGIAVVIFVELLAALTVGLGLMGLRRAYRMRDPGNNAILDLIERRPDEIAWFYVHQVTSEGIQATEALNVIICKSDGKSDALSLIREDVDTVMHELARRAPHAQMGYDAEIQKAWKQRPDRWRPGIG